MNDFNIRNIFNNGRKPDYNFLTHSIIISFWRKAFSNYCHHITTHAAGLSTDLQWSHEDVTIPLWQYDGYYDFGIYEKFTPQLEIPPLVEKPVPKWPPVGFVFDKDDIVSNPWEFNESIVNKNDNYKNVLVSDKTFASGNIKFGVGGKIDRQ